MIWLSLVKQAKASTENEFCFTDCLYSKAIVTIQQLFNLINGKLQLLVFFDKQYSETFVPMILVIIFFYFE